MVSVAHAGAKTRLRIRKETQGSMERALTLAARLNLNVKTVLRWKKAAGVQDKRSGPIIPKSSLSALD